jgi:hypothetical protein
MTGSQPEWPPFRVPSAASTKDRVRSSASDHSFTYSLSVIVGVEWPSAICIVLTLAPAWINNVA